MVFLKHLGVWEIKARLPAKTNPNMLYIAFVRFGRGIYKRRQKSMKAGSKIILFLFGNPIYCIGLAYYFAFVFFY